MRNIIQTSLKKIREEATAGKLEQEITELEILTMEQGQQLTEHDITIMTLQEKIGG